MRPLRRGERNALMGAVTGLLVGMTRVVSRNWQAPEAWKAELGLSLIGVALITAVAWGLKAGAFGGSDD